MPVVVLQRPGTQRLGVQDEIVGHVGNAPVQPAQGLGEDLGQGGERGVVLVGVGGAVMARQHPHLERRARRERGDGDELAVLADQPDLLLDLLADDVAEDAAVLVAVVVQAAFQLRGHLARQDGQGHQLRVAVLERGAGGLAEVLEHHHVAEATVLGQVADPVTEGAEGEQHVVRRQVRETVLVVGALYDHLVGADAVHAIVEPLALLVQVALDDQGRVLVGHHPQLPAGGIGVPPLPAVDEHLVRGGLLVAGAEGAEAALDLELLDEEIGRSFAPFLGDDHPAAQDRVFP